MTESISSQMDVIGVSKSPMHHMQQANEATRLMSLMQLGNPNGGRLMESHHGPTAR